MTADTTSNATTIIVVGSINLDIYLHLHQFPQPGETISTVDTPASDLLKLGGKGCNQAIAAAKLLPYSSTSPVHFVARYGNDANGDALHDLLQKHTVDVRQQLDLAHCKQIAAPTGTAHILLNVKSGENSIILTGGTNQSGWQQQNDVVNDLQAIIATTNPSDTHVLLLQSEIPLSVNLAACKYLRNHLSDVTVYLDLGGLQVPTSGDGKQELSELLKQVDCVTANETELTRLYNVYANQQDVTSEPTNMKHIAQLANEVQKRAGCKELLVTAGSQGSLHVIPHGVDQQAGVFEFHNPAEVAVVDSTGAGDCFRAAFAVFRHVLKLAAVQSMRYADLAARFSLTKQGTVASYPSHSDVRVNDTRTLKDILEAAFDS